MGADEKKPPVGGESVNTSMLRKGPEDRGIFRVAFESPYANSECALFLPMYIRRFDTMQMHAESQRIMISFSGQIAQFSSPSPEGGSTPQDLMPEHVLSIGTGGIDEWIEGLNVTVNVTLSRKTGQWTVEDCSVTDDPRAANELIAYSLL